MTVDETLPDVSHQKAIARLMPVPREYAEAWARVADSGIDDRMRRALLRVAYGSSCREAARDEGYASHQDVARAARRFGLLDAKKDRIINGARRVAQLAQDELEDRLSEKPDDIGARDLAIIAGIAIDKVARAEKWDAGNDGPTTLADMLNSLADFLPPGEKINLKLEVERREAVEVFPIRD
jgi:hypothetical protein